MKRLPPLVLALCLVACSSSDTPTPAPVLPTASPVVIVVTATTEATATVAVTTTSAPPTEAPTAVPVIEPTSASAAQPEAPALAPAAAGISTQSVIDAFKASGLEAESHRSMGKDDYGLAPMVCSGVRFHIPSMGEDKGGRAFVCENAEDMQLLANYYGEISKASALFFSWVFENRNAMVLVQINGELPEDQARKYEAVIAGLK